VFIGDPAFIRTIGKYPPAFNGDPAFIRSFTVLFSTGLVIHKPTRPSINIECVRLRENRGVGLRDWCLLIILPSQAAGQGVVVGSMPAQPGIQSVISY